MDHVGLVPLPKQGQAWIEGPSASLNHGPTRPVEPRDGRRREPVRQGSRSPPEGWGRDRVMGRSSTVAGDLGRLWPPHPPLGPLPLPPGKAMAFMVIDFRPSIADGLAQTAGLSLVLGLAAAGLFAALGLALRRAADNELALLAHAERDRQLAAVGEMSAVLAHEIRNPLTSLKGHALLLQEALPEGRSQDKASRVVKEAERLEALTTDLLSYVRSGAPDRRAVDPVALLRSAMRTRGTGLGLAVAQRVVQQHGGMIAARNHPDGGAELTIRLPAPKEI